MENKRHGGTSFDHLFGPKDSSSAPSSNGVFGSIFQPPYPVQGRDHGAMGYQAETVKGGSPDNKKGKGESSNSGKKSSSSSTSSYYQNETAAEPSYLSSSIYYGGQEYYSPTTTNSSQSRHDSTFKKDGGDDSSANNPNGASRGNWWEGSLYY